MAQPWAHEWHSPTQIFFFFLAKFKQRALVNAVFRPYIWWRYIDDIFMVWTKGEENLKTLLNYLTLSTLPSSSLKNIPFHLYSPFRSKRTFTPNLQTNTNIF